MDRENPFPRDVQRLAARAQHRETGCGPHRGVNEPRDPVEQVLAVVEHQQHWARSHELQQRLGDGHALLVRYREHGRDRVRIGQATELHQPRAAGVAGEHFGRDLHREARLADAADSGERHNARFLEGRHDRGELVVASDERGDLRGQVGWIGVESPQRREVARERRVDDLEHPHGLREIAQAMLAEIDELTAVVEPVTSEHRSRLGATPPGRRAPSP